MKDVMCGKGREHGGRWGVPNYKRQLAFTFIPSKTHPHITQLTNQRPITHHLTTYISWFVVEISPPHMHIFSLTTSFVSKLT